MNLTQYLLKSINFDNKIQIFSKLTYESMQVGYMVGLAMTIHFFVALRCLGIDYLIWHYGFYLHPVYRVLLILTVSGTL